MFESTANELGDFVAKFGHLIGWVAIVGIAWRLRGTVEDQLSMWRNIETQTKSAIGTLSDVKTSLVGLQLGQTAQVSKMREDMTELLSHDNQKMDILQGIKGDVNILIDRGQREIIVETKIKHVDPEGRN